jgi:uncharacterized protein
MYYPPWSPQPHMNSAVISGNGNTIEVTGEGTVSAAPDKAIIVLGVITEHVSLTAAQKDNADAVARIVEALGSLGIPKENMQTTQYSINMQYNYEDGKQIFRGYQVTHLLQVTTEQIDLTGRIVDTAVKNGANTVSNIQFALKNPEIAYNHALSKAIRNGQMKAKTMAQTLSVTLHDVPILVQELPRTPEAIPYLTASTYSKSEATPIQKGELTVSASIKAKFTYH